MIKTFIKNKLFVTSLAAIIFGIYFFIAFTINIHGDAKYHALTAKESAESGYLTQHQPYRIFNYVNSERIYMPIAYPLTTETLFTLFYLFGGEDALKFYAPFFATIIFFLVYLCIKELGQIPSSISALIATLAIGERLFMTPLMEPFLIAMLLMGCLLLKKYVQTNKNSSLYLSALFLGVAMCIKQQGLLISLFIIFFVCCFFIYRAFKKIIPAKQLIRVLSLFILIAFLVPSLAFKNQIDRTGTLAYAPGGTGLNISFPFAQYIQSALNSKFESNPDALQAIRDTIGYNKIKVNLINKTEGFIMSPFLYYRSTDVSYYENYQVMLVSFIALLFFLSIFSRDKIVSQNKFIIILFFGLFVTETISSYLFRTPITQYHSFGVLITTVLIFFLTYRFTFATKYIRATTLCILISFFIIGYTNYLYPLWGQSGREDNSQLEAYKKIGAYVQSTTPSNAVFLAAETSFRYYAKRDIIWLNESIGDGVYNAINAKDEKTAIEKLQKLKVDYVVINKKQVQRRGVNDYLPPEGLISFIDKSLYFTKVYDAFGNNEMVVYKVNYQNTGRSI
jgi:hypothetical protein